ncbi:Stf0 family sulfotransferase [Crocosphaera sp. Alani8]|uniref:Stf0 family sulfotransferase n=1 Tax=Crocosphaera sp. Alani8 TaxID=3038952 RepID=UPI00313CC631
MSIKFIILTTQRTGSTFLAHLLSSHNQIECYSELFQKDLVNRSKRAKVAKHFEIGYEKYKNKSIIAKINHQFFPKQLINKYLTEIYTSPTHVNAVGFKFMYSQDRMIPEVLQWVRNNGVKVIHNTRLNLLKTLVSRETARKRGIWASDEKLPIVKINLDIHKLKLELEKMEKKVSHYRDWCRETDNIEVSYESLINNQKEEIQTILEFLEIPSSGLLTTDIVKMNSDNLRDIVENYEEVCDTLRGSNFEQLLDK